MGDLADWESTALDGPVDAASLWWVVWVPAPVRTAGKPRRRRRHKRLL